MIGKSDDIRLGSDRPWDEMPRIEGWGASKDPQTVSLTCVGLAGAQEPGTPR